jgi:hypothetical protein
MNPRDFCQLAERLVDGGSPAELRTAISCAYYTAYLVAVEILEGMAFRINKGPGGHGDVQHHLNNSGDVDLEHVSSQLGDLQSKRIRADYQLDRPDVENPKTAHAIVIQASQMIETLDRCCSGERRPQIIQGITDWKKKISP